MMISTHPSHFGLTRLPSSESSVIFQGSLGSCKRIAAAHGMEIETYLGRIVSSNNGFATYAAVDEAKPASILYVGGGLIQMTGANEYCVVIPAKVWNESN